MSGGASPEALLPPKQKAAGGRSTLFALNVKFKHENALKVSRGSAVACACVVLFR